MSDRKRFCQYKFYRYDSNHAKKKHANRRIRKLALTNDTRDEIKNTHHDELYGVFSNRHDQGHYCGMYTSPLARIDELLLYDGCCECDSYLCNHMRIMGCWTIFLFQKYCPLSGFGLIGPHVTRIIANYILAPDNYNFGIPNEHSVKGRLNRHLHRHRYRKKRMGIKWRIYMYRKMGLLK
jgi:hypothetical protein